MASSKTQWLGRGAGLLVVLLLLLYPVLVECCPSGSAESAARAVGSQLRVIFVYCLLALGLNVVVGYTGLLHLGIAGFFGIGAYVTGILTVPSYPFQFGFVGSFVCSTLVAAVVGLLLCAPALRLRGDYLAIVTLGFGEVVRFTIQNWESITAGKRGLNPLPPPALPQWLASGLARWTGEIDWAEDYRWFYYLTLGILLLSVWLLWNLERSRLGRAWMALREDELAATCMGLNAARLKLSAFALAAAMAGAAGSLYATMLTNTAGPDAYDFGLSAKMLCCVILGGLGGIRGTLLGVFLIFGFELMISPQIDHFLQNQQHGLGEPLKFSSFNMAVYGLALVLMMRFRPEGFLPAARVKGELHRTAAKPKLQRGT